MLTGRNDSFPVTYIGYVPLALIIFKIFCNCSAAPHNAAIRTPHIDGLLFAGLLTAFWSTSEQVQTYRLYHHCADH